ncbi:equilibrative nucleoside transporter 1-like isoform X2 [Zophobas morio]|uniref:equilibrative nucleoside transporter 1-like isoform X2 n=1 Tax=Zophobas morio TaxID=2755281 RepID=UPI003083140F
MSTQKDLHTCEQNEKNEKTDYDPPEDHFYINYILFFLIGLVHSLPGTFFTTATNFWMYKFRNTTIDTTDSEFRTDLQAEFSASVKVVQPIANLAFQLLTVYYGRYFKVRQRKIFILVVTMLLCCLTMIFVKVDTDSWQGGFFAMAMMITGGLNAMTGIFSVTMYTTCAFFPHGYIGAYIMGEGLAAIFTAMAQLISLAFGLSSQDSALVYFGIGLFVIIVTLLALLATGNNQFYVYHMNRIHDRTDRIINLKDVLHILKKIWSSLVISGCYLIASDSSPTGLVVSEYEGSGPWNDLYFIPTITYLVNSSCSLIGRGIALMYVPKVKNVVWSVLSVVRMLIFIPVFMLCNAQPRNHLPVLIPHDYQYIVIILVYSVSGGYLLSRCSYNIANLVTQEELKKAYQVYSLFLGLQMSVYSPIGLLFVQLL